MKLVRLVEHFDRAIEAPDAVQKLRRFIVDLAVRGKLVEQDPNDAPAADLIGQISSRRAELVRTGELPEQDLSAAVRPDEEPFPLPPTWAWIRLGYGFTYDAGLKRDAKNLVGDRWLLDLEDIEKDTSCLLVRAKVSDRESLSTKSEFNVGDVLYGKLRPYLNKVIVADRPGYCTTEIVAIRAIVPMCSAYLCLALRRPDFVDYVTRLGRGTKMPRLRRPDALRALLPLPPLAEQRRIVAKVDELISLCDRLERATGEREQLRRTAGAASLNALATISARGTMPAAPIYLNHLDRFAKRPDQIAEVREAIVNLALHGLLAKQNAAEAPADRFLRSLAVHVTSARDSAGAEPLSEKSLAKDDIPHELPNGWVWARLSSLCRSITDGDHLPPPRAEQGVAFLTIGNISSGRIDFEGCRLVPQTYFDALASHRRPSRGDLLYTVVGATYGRATLVDTERDFCVQRHIAILKPAAGSNVRFLLLLLKSSLVYGQATKGITGAAQPTIPIRSLRNFVVPVPPLAEQERIVARVEQLMAISSELQLALNSEKQASTHLLDAAIHEALNSNARRRDHFHHSTVLAFPDASQGTRSNAPSRGPGSSELVPVPILGTIAAGVLTLADQRVEGWLHIPAAMVRPADDAWCVLRVSGDSMNLAMIDDARIEDGDFLLVRRQSSPEINKVVVAEFEGDGVLKRFVKAATGFVLRAESTGHYPDISVGPGFRIQGVVRANLKSGVDYERTDADEV